MEFTNQNYIQARNVVTTYSHAAHAQSRCCGGVICVYLGNFFEVPNLI